MPALLCARNIYYSVINEFQIRLDPLDQHLRIVAVHPAFVIVRAQCADAVSLHALGAKPKGALLLAVDFPSDVIPSDLTERSRRERGICFSTSEGRPEASALGMTRRSH